MTELEMKSESELRVEITYGNLKASFSGQPETVLHSINSFLSREIPSLSIAYKLLLQYPATEIAEKFQSFVRITPEGPRVLTGERKISDKEVVGLQLAAQLIAQDAGKEDSSWVSLTKLQEYIGLNPKTLSSRLSELLKAGSVAKEAGADGPSFKLTTIGISWLAESLSRKN